MSMTRLRKGDAWRSEQSVALEAGRLDLHGTPKAWALDLDTAATLAHWPRLALNARAQGDLE
ncbi:MAG: hypothetical protein R6U00_02015, partial [Prochlorococcaceae cyanobacterium]